MYVIFTQNDEKEIECDSRMVILILHSLVGRSKDVSSIKDGDKIITIVDILPLQYRFHTD